MTGGKDCGKRRKCWLPAFPPFPIMFSKGSFFRVVKCRDCVRKTVIMKIKKTDQLVNLRVFCRDIVLHRVRSDCNSYTQLSWSPNFVKWAPQSWPPVAIKGYNQRCAQHIKGSGYLIKNHFWHITRKGTIDKKIKIKTGTKRAQADTAR